MNETDAPQPTPADSTEPAWRAILEDPPVRTAEWTPRDSVKLAVGAGLLLAVVGVGVGVILTAERARSACTGAAIFVSESGDGSCFAHPQALEGTAVIAISLMLAILIALTGAVAKALLDVRTGS